MDMKKIEKIKASFTDEQYNLYNVLLGDKDKLKAEWMLCRRMYDQAVAIIKAKETGPEVRLLLMKASTDYWSRRRLALERTMEEVGMNADLAEWRKEADAKS
jgi:hypothetical protein